MTNSNDRKIIETMMDVPEVSMAQYFMLNHHRIQDDALYWNVLGSLWKLGGTVIQQDLWILLISSPRRQRHKIMKNRERKKWRRLPKTFVAFRAVNTDDEIDSAISWSLSREVVEKVFSRGGSRKIVSRQFYKDDVFAFFDRRGEDEILVNVYHK